jgi:hypothetical protein
LTMLVYPTLPGLTYTVLKAMDFDTLSNSSPNKYEVRLPQTINPLWSWELIYDFIRDLPFGSFTTVSELRTLLDFFLFQSGSAGDFLFLDPDDNSVGPGLVAGAPNVPLAQLQVVTDGNGNFFSPLQRTFAGNFFEDITDLNTNVDAGGQPLAVFANGAETSNYTLEGPGLAVPGAAFMGLYLAWNAEPAAPVTAQFSYYFRAHFQSDSQDMEKFANKFWTIGGSESQNGKGYLKLQQSRPQPL